MRRIKAIGFVFSLSVLSIACGTRNANVEATPVSPLEQPTGDETTEFATEITSEEQALGLDPSCICGKYRLNGCPKKYRDISCVNSNGVIAIGRGNRGWVYWFERR